MKNIFKITLVILAVVLCLGVLVSCDKGLTLKSVEEDPYAALESASQKYLDAIDSKYGKFFDAFEKASEGTGTHKLTLSVPDTIDATFDIAANAASGAASGKVTVGLGGISAELDVWADKNQLVLSLPALLGEGNYGIKFDTLEEDLKNSYLLESMGLSYADLEESLEAEGLKLEDIKSMFDQSKFTAAMDKYVADVEAIIKDLTPTVAEETVGETETITMLYTINKDTAEKFMNAVKDAFNTVFSNMLEAAGEDIDAIFTTEDIDTDITVKYYLVKKTGDLLKYDMSQGEELSITVDYSQDMSSPLNMTVAAKFTEDDAVNEVTATLKESDDEGTSGIYFDSVIKASYDGETEEITGGMSFLVNDENGKYEFEIIGNGETLFAANGTLTYSETEFAITISSVTVDGESVSMNASYSVKAEGTVEAIPEYTNIITVTEDDLMALVNNIYSSDIMSMFMFGGMEDEYYDDEYWDDEYYDDEFIWDTEIYDDVYWDTYEWDTEIYDDEYWDTYEWDTEE